MGFRVRPDRLPFETAISSEGLYEASQLLSQLTSEPVQSNKAIVGRNAFAHEAGIHQDGVIKDPRTYEIMRPQDVGQPTARLVLGRHSGRHAVQSRCEALGFHFTAEELDQVYHSVITAAEHRKAIGDGDLRRIIERIRTAATAALAPGTARAESLGHGHGV
jgi:2-isopropylmalate synthase